MFFSNPIGLLTICLLEWKQLGKFIPIILASLLIIIESFVMIVFRQHYIIDILSALLFAHYFFILVEIHVKHLDNKIDAFFKKSENISLTEEKMNLDI